jgi:hypothetical protein
MERSAASAISMGLDGLHESEPEGAYLVRRSATILISMLWGLHRAQPRVIRTSIALLSLVIFVYSAGAQDNSVLTYHGDAGRSGNFVVPALGEGAVVELGSRI